MLGKYKVSVDSKNRICIPHKFRGKLGINCVLSKDMEDKCLNLYSLDQWNIFIEKIEQLPVTRMKRARQFINYNSDDVELDSQGRIVLNQQFCKDVGFVYEKEVMIAGNTNYIQIWSLTEWEDFYEKLNSEESRADIIGDLLEMEF